MQNNCLNLGMNKILKIQRHNQSYIIILIMNDQLRNLLIVGGLLGAGYFALNKLTSTALPLDLTTRIIQQIKHQMLIVTINFAQGSKANISKIKQSNPDKTEQVIQYFRTKMAQIYNQKQQLILGKYEVPKQKLSVSLQHHSSNDKIKRIQTQIYDMMQRAVNGQIPDLTVDKKVKAKFNKKQMKQIYQDMSKMILVALVSKLQSQKKQNSFFDASNDVQFKKIVKDLNIYNKKVEFFKNRGFNPEWGCPNQNFFKYNQSLKIQDPQYKKQMLRLEQIYQEVVDKASTDPLSVNIQKLNDFYTISKNAEVPKQQVSAIKVTHPLQKQYKLEVIPNQVVPRSEQENKQKIVHHPVVKQNIVNVDHETKSEPQKIQEPAKIENKQELENPHFVGKAHSLAEPLQQVVSQEEKKVTFDEVPNDAHELNQQLQQQSAAEHSQQEKNEEKAESNVSVDGDEAKKESSQNQVEHIENKVEDHVQPEIQQHEQPKVQEEQPKIEEQAQPKVEQEQPKSE